jgi:hypothetical protein
MKKVPPIKELKVICRKRIETEWRDKFNRSITIYFTKLFLHLGLTPDKVSVIALIVGLLSVSFFAVGSYGYILLAVLMHHFSHVLDGSDGEMARFDKDIRTGKGPFLEIVFFFVLFPLMLLAMGVGAYFNNPLPIPDYVFLVAGLSASYFLFLGGLIRPIEFEHLIQKGDFKKLREYHNNRKVKISRLEVQARFFFNPGELFNIVFFAGILNLVWLMILFFALWYPLLFFRKLYLTGKKLDKDFDSKR